jgi:hypothetical protein
MMKTNHRKTRIEPATETSPYEIYFSQSTLLNRVLYKASAIVTNLWNTIFVGVVFTVVLYLRVTKHVT